MGLLNIMPLILPILQDPSPWELGQPVYKPGKAGTGSITMHLTPWRMKPVTGSAQGAG